MNKNVRKIVTKMAELLVKEYEPEKIILFGSYAYGQPDEESDIDLLIVVKTSLPFFKRLAEVRRITSTIRRGYAFEPLVLTPDELEGRLKMGDQFFEEIITKGDVLYAKT